MCEKSFRSPRSRSCRPGSEVGDQGSGEGVKPSVPQPLTISCDGETTPLDEGAPETLLAELNRLIRRFDPHVIITDWGDAFLVPALLALARCTDTPPEFDRGAGRGGG